MGSGDAAPRSAQAGHRIAATLCVAPPRVFGLTAFARTRQSGGPEDINQDRDTKALRMERSSKRGKIPPQDWPSIITRYQAGETLASIARTYDCSPPAISYIVSRTRAKNAAADAQNAAPPQESQLVKSYPAPAPIPELAAIDSPPAESGAPAAPSGEQKFDQPPAAAGP